MSLIVEIFPQCDFCLYVNKDMDGPTKEYVRKVMKNNDWRIVNGKDMCDVCAAGEKRIHI